MGAGGGWPLWEIARPGKRYVRASRRPNAEVRAWAAANGVACSPHGRIPAAVRAQYQAAQRATATRRVAGGLLDPPLV